MSVGNPPGAGASEGNKSSCYRVSSIRFLDMGCLMN